MIHRTALSLLFALPLLVAGCAAIPLATLGTVAGIAGSAASTGPAVYQMGKLDIAFMADFPTVQQAVRSAAYDLRLIVIEEKYTDKGDTTWKCQFEDDLQSPLTITVDRRTPMLCRCRVDVGLFGSETTAKLVMTRISTYILPVQARQPTTRPSQSAATEATSVRVRASALRS